MEAIRVYWQCYLCGRRSGMRDANDPGPTGWRSVKRGYLGEVDICPECNKEKRRFLREAPAERWKPIRAGDKASDGSIHMLDQETDS